MAEKAGEKASKSPHKSIEHEDVGEFKVIILDSLRLLKKTFFPSVGLIVFFSFVAALFSLLLLVPSSWELQNISTEIQVIQDYAKDPNYVVPSNFQDLQFRALQLSLYILVMTSFLQFLCPIGLLLLGTGKIYSLYQGDKDSPKTWVRSIFEPFSTGRKSFTSITLLILLSFFIPIGIMLFFIPGILLMVFGFFQIHSFLLDEKYGRDIIKGGAFYARDNFAKIVVLLFLGFFLPWLLSYLIAEPMLTVIGLSDRMNLEVIAPESRNYGFLLLFYFINFTIQNVFYFWFPALMLVAFVKIRGQKLQMLKNIVEKNVEKDDSVKKMDIQAGQRNYTCKVCGQKLPLSAKKCNKCGQLYKLVLKR